MRHYSDSFWSRSFLVNVTFIVVWRFLPKCATFWPRWSGCRGQLCGTIISVLSAKCPFSQPNQRASVKRGCVNGWVSSENVKVTWKTHDQIYFDQSSSILETHLSAAGFQGQLNRPSGWFLVRPCIFTQWCGFIAELVIFRGGKKYKNIFFGENTAKKRTKKNELSLNKCDICCGIRSSSL